MKSPLVVISVIGVVLVILAGVAYLFLPAPSPTGPPEQVTPPVEQSVPPGESKPASEQPALSLEEQMEDFKTAMADVCAAGERKEVTLVITEAEANNLTAQMLTRAEMPEDLPLEIRGVHLDFETDNNLAAEIGGVVYGFGVTIKSRVQVGVEGGKPRVKVTEINFGFIPLPQAIKDRIVVYITQEIDNSLSQLTETTIDCDGTISVEFQDINVQPTKMTVTVVIRPRM